VDEVVEFTRGQQVTVKGTTSSRWVFAYANYRRSGELDSYTVIGGSVHGQKETKEFRSFAPERVHPVEKVLTTAPRKNGRRVNEEATDGED